MSFIKFMYIASLIKDIKYLSKSTDLIMKKNNVTIAFMHEKFLSPYKPAETEGRIYEAERYIWPHLFLIYYFFYWVPSQQLQTFAGSLTAP